jgi:hypothetical protein
MEERMKKYKRFGLVLTDQEKLLISRLAVLEGGLSQAALIRRLVLKAAIQQGLVRTDLPPSLTEEIPNLQVER